MHKVIFIVITLPPNRCSTPKGFSHHNRYIISAHITKSIVESSSCVIGRPWLARAMLWTINQTDWTQAKPLVNASALLKSWIFCSCGSRRSGNAASKFPGFNRLKSDAKTDWESEKWHNTTVEKQPWMKSGKIIINMKRNNGILGRLRKGDKTNLVPHNYERDNNTLAYTVLYTLLSKDAGCPAKFQSVASCPVQRLPARDSIAPRFSQQTHPCWQRRCAS